MKSFLFYIASMLHNSVKSKGKLFVVAVSALIRQNKFFNTRFKEK